MTYYKTKDRKKQENVKKDRVKDLSIVTSNVNRQSMLIKIQK